jgi:hypothetical protein
MRYIYLVVLVIVFVSLVAYCCHSGEKRLEIRDRVMLNGLFIKGKVLAVKTSKNHSFGILLLKVDSLNTGKFADTILKEGIYPCKIAKGKAEIYVAISDGIQVGDEVIVDSDKKTASYHYIKENKHYEGYLGVVIDPYDIEYVKENTVFK